MDTKLLLFLLFVGLWLGEPLQALAAKPNPPTDLQPRVSGNTVTLNWTAPTSSGITEYRVERCIEARCVSFAQIDTATETRYTDTGLSAGSSYSYRVRAVNADGVGDPSNPASATIPNGPGMATQQDFAGLHFGVGVSYTQTLGRTRIKSASVDPTGIVRIDSEANAIPRVMLESHYFFTPRHESKEFCVLFLPFMCMETRGWGAGPFVALQPGTDQVIQAIAAGVMWGFKYSRDTNDSRSWNLGIGASVEPNSKTLADGFNDGQPLPAGQTQVLFKDRTLVGIVALLSFGFF